MEDLMMLKNAEIEALRKELKKKNAEIEEFKQMLKEVISNEN